MRILTACYLLFVSWQSSDAFQSAQEWRPHRPKTLLFSSRQPNRSGWNKVKHAVYGGVDGIEEVASKMKGDGDVPKVSRVEGGYSSFEASIKRSPAKKNMGEYQAQASTLGGDTPSQPQPSRSVYDSFKESIHNTVDDLDSENASAEPVVDRNVPYTKSLAEEFNNENSESSNPIEHSQAEQEIREREALKRATIRNKEIKAKKEDLDSIPETAKQTKKTVKDVAQFVQSVLPDHVGKTVEEAKAITGQIQQSVDKTKKSLEDSAEKSKQVVREVQDIPNNVKTKIDDTKRTVEQTKESLKDSIEKSKQVVREVQNIPNNVKTKIDDTKRTVEQTKESLKDSIEKTKQVIREVQDIPNKVKTKIDDTERTVEQTKESLDATLTKVKVLVGLEKPKPPKVPPPKPKSNKEIALDVAGRVAGGAGKLAWFATKGATHLAWSGAQAALEKGSESQLEGNSKAEATPSLDPVVAKSEVSTQKVVIPKMDVIDTEDVEKEVADALKFAEDSLRQASKKE